MLLRKLPVEPEGILGMLIAPPHVCSLANGIPGVYESLIMIKDIINVRAERSRTRAWNNYCRRHGQRARTFCSRKLTRCEELLFTADTYKKNDRLAVSNHRGASVLKRLKRLSSTMYIVIYLSIVREAP
jgi:hypothetical protein